ncbi:metallophosphoesterase, partial [bacterium]|nr:metallophosphoesterase [bacterium]
MDKNIIAIADSHLGTTQGDVETMICFLETLNPEKEELLFLGDLFHIWAGPLKYHTSQVKKLLSSLRVFQQNGGKTHLVVGNRDVFLPRISRNNPVSFLPFDSINGEYVILKRQGGTLMAVHGDTVNSKDKQYLRWRRLLRSTLFRGFFNLMPAWKVKKIMFNLEEK